MLLLLIAIAVAGGCVSQPQREVPALAMETRGTLPEVESGAMDLNEANVVRVEFMGEGGSYTFWVRVRHNDTGWEHYADWWRIKTLQGEEIARRVLAHPPCGGAALHPIKTKEVHVC